MFSVFKTRGGKVLYIRAVDIRAIVDVTETTSKILWEIVHGQLQEEYIEGTAEENLNRLKQEETDALIASEKLRQRQAQGYPPEPIQRGKQSMRMVSK